MALLRIQGLTVSPKSAVMGGPITVSWDSVNAAGALTAPATDARIYFYSPEGVLVNVGTGAGGTVVSASPTGKYVYDYPTVNSKTAGTWKVKVRLDNASTDQSELWESFKVLLGSP